MELEIAKKKNNINFKMTPSWRTEMLAACSVGWMILPLFGSFLLNTGVGIVAGSVFYFANDFLISFTNDKLFLWLFEQKVKQLEKNQIISAEEANIVHTLGTQNHFTFSSHVNNLLSSLTTKLTRAFPIVVFRTEEEIQQKKYMIQLEREYVDWRQEKGLEPAGKFFDKS